MHDNAEEVIDEQQPKGPRHGGEETNCIDGVGWSATLNPR